MAKNPRLDEAVAIFTELGWARARTVDAPDLPVGTAEQRAAAVAGLRTGDWACLEDGWRRRVEAKLARLVLFAVRVGVDGRRAANLVAANWTWEEADTSTIAVLVDQRERRFAETFVNRAAAIDEWGYPTVVVGLVVKHGLPVPQRVPYLRAWQGMITELVDGRSVDHGGVLPVTGAERFAEHIAACVAMRLPPTGLDTLLVDAVARGWVDRAEAVRLVLTGLDTALRPVDRRTWLRTWTDALGATDAEVVAHGDVLVPVLASGESVVVERLAPALVAGVGDATLVDVVTAALAVTTKKAQRVVLTALAARPRPSDATVGALEPQVTALQTSRDAGLARTVASVVERWGLRPAVRQVAVVTGMWQATPPVWTVPAFDHGEESADALAQVTAELVQRPSRFDEPDVVFERFLAVANAVARTDPAAARVVLRGVSDDTVHCWMTNTAIRPSADPLRARKDAVFARLGEVPCLLSEPSTIDMHVAPTDLVTRLRAYRDAGAAVSEADLFWALTRLDTSLADAQVRAELDELDVSVLSHVPLGITAGPAVRVCLDEPLVEPGLVCEARYGHNYRWKNLFAPGLVRVFSESRVKPALTTGSWSADFLERQKTVFPSWGDPALCWFWDECDDGQAVRQLVRRAAPLPPGAAANLLMLRAHVEPRVVGDVATAVSEAWTRGLLRPGVPDLGFLDWDAPKLAARARALADAAADGLLSVAWPLLDELAARATGVIACQCWCGRPAKPTDRLLAGAGDVVGVIAGLLPEVKHAVETGLADVSVLDLPGVRAIAARSGSSQAVKTARAVVGQLRQ
ncbi:MAG: hypothetical protein FWF02_14445 [Micrococcales bacterium]|nr:hypothetical protein [Micrococcales bacterium]MCL2668877.1 hypothetical protein [Micrococcales bacterium]